MAKMTQQKITQAIKDGYTARPSIAFRLGVTLKSLEKFGRVNDLSWLIPARLCDIHLVRSIMRFNDVKTATQVSKLGCVPKSRVIACMLENDLDPDGHEPDVAFWPARTLHGWKEFPRVTNDIKLARAVAA